MSGLTIRIWADEHPPPHFHVSYQGQDASFSIIDCSRLTGSNGLERYERTIREWWRDNTVELIESWNASRPTHCPVGPVQLAGVKDSLRSSSTANMSDLEREMENLLKKLRLGSGS
ncbi:DUF4160 domain-containing protein [Nitrobacter sp. TKz-YC01]|uniref:DUF4160 domain-containing protein n=1 Tax=Nitrobacter sp. TKz-YC01 TaxID=3398703 RepID=UPI003A0FBFD3